MTSIVPDLLTIGVMLVAIFATVEVLRYMWALAACSRQVRKSDALRKLRDPHSPDVSGPTLELDKIHNEGTVAQIASVLWRIVLALFALSWVAAAVWLMREV